MFAVKVTGLRKGPWGGVVAYFDVTFGDQSDKGFIPVFVAKGYALKEKNAGGYFFQAPSKKRLKNGQAVKDDKGFDIWDPIVDVVFEDKKISRASLKMKDQILAQATEQVEAEGEGNAGRGAAKPKAKTAAAPAKKRAPAPPPVEEEEDLPESVEDEDDDLPF